MHRTCREPVIPWPFPRWADSPRFVAQEIDPHVGNVCYAVTAADVDGDGKLDVVAVSEDAVVWYQNPAGRGTTSFGASREGQRLHPAPRHRRRRPGRFRPGRRLAARRHRPGQHAPVAGPRQGRPVAGPPDPVRRADAASPAVGRRQGHGQEAARRAPSGRGTKGPNWGEGQGVRSWSTTSPPTPRRRVAHGSRRPDRSTRFTTSSSSISMATARRDRAGLLGGRLLS